MTIHHFAEHQNDVFLPAALLVLIAVVLGALPVVFAPGLRRARSGRSLTAVAAVVAAVSLVAGAWQAGLGVRILQDERARIGAEVRTGYGLDLDAGQVAMLVDGDVVPLRRFGEEGVRLVRTDDGPDAFELRAGRSPLPRQA